MQKGSRSISRGSTSQTDTSTALLKLSDGETKGSSGSPKTRADATAGAAAKSTARIDTAALRTPAVFLRALQSATTGTESANPTRAAAAPRAALTQAANGQLLGPPKIPPGRRKCATCTMSG